MDRWPQRQRFKGLVSAYRADHNLRRREMAEALGIAEPTLHNYLYNKKLAPSIDVLQRAATLFGVSITEFVDDPAGCMPGLDPVEFAKASEIDRALIHELFRDLLRLQPEQKQAAFDLWKAALKVLAVAK